MMNLAQRFHSFALRRVATQTEERAIEDATDPRAPPPAKRRGEDVSPLDMAVFLREENQPRKRRFRLY